VAIGANRKLRPCELLRDRAGGFHRDDRQGTKPVGSNVRSGVSRAISVITASIVLLVACGDANDPGHEPAESATLEITALAGPVCPVESDPPLPDCAPRPVDNANIVVLGPGGAERARGTTGSDGTLLLEVARGELTIVPQPVEGLLGTAAAVTVTAAAGQTLRVTIDYDTGIR
jgi:hypothetical protein